MLCCGALLLPAAHAGEPAKTPPKPQPAAADPKKAPPAPPKPAPAPQPAKPPAPVAAAPAKPLSHAEQFTQKFQPLLNKFCLGCHDDMEPDGDVSLTKYTTIESIQRNPKTFHTVLRVLNERVMPPRNKPQPSQLEREALIDFLTYTLNNIDDSRLPPDPGRVVIHRLSRLEYNNTVRDLFGIASTPADAFPVDGGGGGGFDNNADTLFVPPLLMEKLVDAADAVLTEAKPERIYVARPENGLTPRAAAEKIVAFHGPRIFRRPLREGEAARWLKLYETLAGSAPAPERFEYAVRQTLKGMLCSPNFLFRSQDEQQSAQPYLLGDYELASRLSYFLWASMPDAELFAAAQRGDLRDPAARAAQVRRMLADPKARAFAANFTTQWLGLNQLLTNGPDRRLFKHYTDELRDQLMEEPVEFTDRLLRENGRLVDLLDGDYTYLNETLAKHYGIPGVTGTEFRRVKYPDRTRGGVLGMGGVLTLTSYPLRTSPVLRGKWVLEEILGAPPPPPPPMAGVLPQDDAPKDGLTFRQRMELHRKKAECANCHSRMDPIGFGLENFDPTGRWRTTVSKAPVDASGEMSTGERFNGPQELRTLLLKRKDEFARNLTEKMLAYALGRGLEYYDQSAVRKITGTLKKDDRMQTLVVEITNSYPFLYRRGTATETAARNTP